MPVSNPNSDIKERATLQAGRKTMVVKKHWRGVASRVEEIIQRHIKLKVDGKGSKVRNATAVGDLPA
jgi:hypothetical protein